MEAPHYWNQNDTYPKAKIGRDEYVDLEIIERICNKMRLNIPDVIDLNVIDLNFSSNKSKSIMYDTFSFYVVSLLLSIFCVITLTMFLMLVLVSWPEYVDSNLSIIAVIAKRCNSYSSLYSLYSRFHHSNWLSSIFLES